MRIVTALMLTLCVLCMSYVPAHSRVFSDDVQTTVEATTPIDAYESSAAALRAIDASASVKCSAGEIRAKACGEIKRSYTEARTAFLKTGDARKAYLKSPSGVAKRKWLRAADDSTVKLKKLKSLAKKHGVGVPK